MAIKLTRIRGLTDNTVLTYMNAYGYILFTQGKTSYLYKPGMDRIFVRASIVESLLSKKKIAVELSEIASIIGYKLI